jgi:hypothetical protein
MTAVTIKNKESWFPGVLRRYLRDKHITQPLERDLVIRPPFLRAYKVPIFKEVDIIREPLLLN